MKLYNDIIKKVYVLFSTLVIFSSCDGLFNIDVEEKVTDYNYFIKTFEERTKGQPQSFIAKEKGKLNSIKKAYQLTDFRFTPVGTFEFNSGSYLQGIEYKGVPYSSTKEIGTSVPGNVSFYTFATAIRNPRSKLYTERINEPPYHGTNCRAFYGTVCSAFVSSALGLSPGYGSYDFVQSEQMEDIGYKVPEDIVVADVLWTDSHVAIITDVVLLPNGLVETIEVSEAIQSGCRRNRYTRDGFEECMQNRFEKVFRYKFIERNIDYQPQTGLVSVAGEAYAPMQFNDKICVDKGDCSNYLVGEDIVMNIFSPYDSLGVFKDGRLYQFFSHSDSTSDITLSNLPYGSYEAILWRNSLSKKTEWIVIDYSVSYNPNEQTIFFDSKNAIPTSIRFCTQSGSRGDAAPLNKLIAEEELNLGCIYVPSDTLPDENYSYVQLKLKTLYGIASTLPIKVIR